MRALQFSRVTYQSGRAYELMAAIAAWATNPSLPDSGEAPGVDQADAVQLATHITLLRGICLAGTATNPQVAWYNTLEHFVGMRYWECPAPKNGLTRIPVYGEERYKPPRYGSGQMGKRWSYDLAMALGSVLSSLVKTERGPAAVSAFAVPHGLEAGRVPMLVAGPAVKVIKQHADWRYLWTGLRTDLAYIVTAAGAFETRLRAMEYNGVEIPPTPAELAAADYVREAARTTRNREALIGGGTVAGSSVGVTLLAAIRSRAAA
jgi:hypothetical protein